MFQKRLLLKYWIHVLLTGLSELTECFPPQEPLYKSHVAHSLRDISTMNCVVLVLPPSSTARKKSLIDDAFCGPYNFNTSPLHMKYKRGYLYEIPFNRVSLFCYGVSPHCPNVSHGCNGWFDHIMNSADTNTMSVYVHRQDLGRAGGGGDKAGRSCRCITCFCPHIMLIIVCGLLALHTMVAPASIDLAGNLRAHSVSIDPLVSLGYPLDVR